MGLPEEVVLEMLKLGADPKSKNSLGAVPLTHAVYSKMSENVIRALVKGGADPNYQNQSGGTALQTACVCKAPISMIKLLLELGADPLQENVHGNTALIFAVRNHNELGIVQLLAEKTGPKHIDHKTHDDDKFHEYTALHFAAVEDQPAVAATLVKYGAQTDVLNGDGLTPLQLCQGEKTKIAMMSAERAREEGY